MRRVETPQRVSTVTPGSITAQGVPIAQIVASAAGALCRPVRDTTGLSENYEVNLTWTPEDTVLAGAENESPAPGDRPPSIFTALQEQRGLRLEPRQFPIPARAARRDDPLAYPAQKLPVTAPKDVQLEN